MGIEFDVRIENVYEDPLESSPDAMVAAFETEAFAGDAKASNVEVEIDRKQPNIAAVTCTIEVSWMPEEGEPFEEWDVWADECILPFTGIGKQDGDSGYFAEIVACRHTEYQHAVGRTFEWGV